MRGRARWLLSLPLAGAGWLSAHQLAYRLVPPPDAHAAHLERAAHGYLPETPLFVAFALSAVVAALAVLATAVLGRPRSRPPALVFALLPPLGFVVQEAVERVLTGEPLTTLALEPVFLVGLLLQLPFAVAALAVARFLLEVSHELGRRLADALRQTWRAPRASRSWPGSPDLPPVSALAGGHAQRGPPVVLVAP